MLTCDCTAGPDAVTHEPGCIHYELETDDPSDHYDL